jgi:hypothetical protein
MESRLVEDRGSYVQRGFGGAARTTKQVLRTQQLGGLAANGSFCIVPFPARARCASGARIDPDYGPAVTGTVVLPIDEAWALNRSRGLIEHCRLNLWSTVPEATQQNTSFFTVFGLLIAFLSSSYSLTELFDCASLHILEYMAIRMQCGHREDSFVDRPRCQF